MNEHPILDTSLEEALKQEAMMADIMEALEGFETKAAVKLLDTYESSYGEDEFWHIVSIDIAEQQSDPESMLEAIHAAQQFGIDSDELALRYGRFCYMVGRPEEALEYLKECKFEEDTDQEFYKTHLEAYCSLIAQDYKTAVSKLEDLLLDTDDYRILTLAALCYQELHKEDRAREYLDKALESREDFSEEYAKCLEVYDFDPEKILANTGPLFDELAGTRSTDVQPALMTQILEGMSWLENHEEVDDAFYAQFGSLLEEEMNSPMYDVFKGMYYSKLGSAGKAKNQWRTALTSPWVGHDATDMMDLFFRLLALEFLQYSNQTIAKHLRRMWDEKPVGYIRMELMAFATQHELHNLLGMMTKEENRPPMTNEAEANAFDLARAKALLELDRFTESRSILKSLWDAMQDDEDYLLAASAVAAILHDEKMLLECAKRLMPHGVSAFHLLQFYDLEGNPAACRKVQKVMKKALENPDIEVPEEEFYREFLRSFQQRHRQ